MLIFASTRTLAQVTTRAYIHLLAQVTTRAYIHLLAQVTTRAYSTCFEVVYYYWKLAL